MKPIRRRVFICCLALALPLAASASPADREGGPRDPGNRSHLVQAVKNFLAHILGGISIPPG
jgi:hypothetical protein